MVKVSMAFFSRPPIASRNMLKGHVTYCLFTKNYYLALCLSMARPRSFRLPIAAHFSSVGSRLVTKSWMGFGG